MADLQQQITALQVVLLHPTIAEDIIDDNSFVSLQPAQPDLNASTIIPHCNNIVNNDPRWEIGIKVGLPKFHGDLQVE